MASNISKFEAALMTVPMDLIAPLITFAAEQAFMWTGIRPTDDKAFYIEQGRQLQRFREIAWEKELESANSRHRP